MPEEPLESSTPTSAERIALLVVDDQDRARRSIVTLLGTCPGFSVVGEAKDGADAIGQVERLMPDVVLMDARMPVMDGIAATRQIKRRWPDVGVLVVTMYADLAEDAEAAGADAFLLKGCEVGLLTSTIRTVSCLSRRRAGRGASDDSRVQA